jgi:hypothetical protein
VLKLHSPIAVTPMNMCWCARSIDLRKQSHRWLVASFAAPDTIPLATPRSCCMGIEADGDSIDSNNLGQHARNRAAGYLDLDLHPAKSRWNLVRRSSRRGFLRRHCKLVFAPHLAGSLRLPMRSSCAPAEAMAFAFRPTPTFTTPTPPPSAIPTSNPSRHGAEMAASTGIPNARCAFCHRLLFAPARRHRLRARLVSRSMASGQSQRPAL